MNEENEFHNNPHNWKLGIFYFNRQDKRILVFKRVPYTGFTINFANPYSVLVVLGFAAFLIFLARAK